ncbi:hypothetical protein GCM10025868_15450 [Angustibacter aerolatus]|uniref:N-acetyltransferase domain-containing protein n=1 Tax=Angustibacter aerolatus TaxID=1162965 RepID=A0ABQ6JDM4_9ACTN|nr:hypothetical protein [Angustibacter aerolatus]GMA86295.1 hypothetical protein GCM10025868_15450 [Angustibacter aerolatus]
MTTEVDAGRLEVRALSTRTWPAFAALAERHNGVWGGCWDTWFHTMSHEKERTYDANRALKQRLVEEGRAHGAVVFDGEGAVGWCQYGSPAEPAEHQPPQGDRADDDRPARRPHHLLLRRPPVPAAGCGGPRARRGRRADRAVGWRGRRGLSAGDL